MIAAAQRTTLATLRIILLINTSCVLCLYRGLYQIHLIYVIHNDNKHDSFLLIKRYTSTKAHRLCSPLFIIILDVLSQLGSKPPESMLFVTCRERVLRKGG